MATALPSMSRSPAGVISALGRPSLPVEWMRRPLILMLWPSPMLMLPSRSSLRASSSALSTWRPRKLVGASVVAEDPPDAGVGSAGDAGRLQAARLAARAAARSRGAGFIAGSPWRGSAGRECFADVGFAIVDVALFEGGVGAELRQAGRQPLLRGHHRRQLAADAAHGRFDFLPDHALDAALQAAGHGAEEQADPGTVADRVQRRFRAALADVDPGLCDLHHQAAVGEQLPALGHVDV